ncbi:hypothetical protein BGW38_008052, partial [Lunasporangiospora selenospora]
NEYNPRSSAYIFSFIILNIITTSINIRTLHQLTMTSQSQFIAFCVYFGSIVIGLVFESWPRSFSPHHQQNSGNTTNGSIPSEQSTSYERANLFSRLSFHYMQKIISLGYRQQIQIEDIANMMPHPILTAQSHPFMDHTWKSHLQNCRNRNGDHQPSLTWIVLKAGGKLWIPIIALTLLESVADYIQPIFLDAILNFIADFSKEASQDVSLGIILAFAMFFAAVVGAIASGQVLQLSKIYGLRVKAGLASMIYRKSLRLSPRARREATVGEISNHMAVDVTRVCEGISQAAMIISSPFEIAVGMWLLYRQLGPSCFTGLGVVILITPVQGWIAGVLARAKDKKLEAMDGRVRLLTELLSGIKIVKLYAWERPFAERLNVYRTKELKHVVHMGATIAFMMIMFTSLPNLMALLSLTVYSLVGGPGGSNGNMSPQVVFVSITLFNRLAKPIGRVSVIINQAISLLVATKRIQKFLLQEELDESQIEFDVDSNDKHLPTKEHPEKVALDHVGGHAAIQMTNSVFSWESAEAIDASLPTSKTDSTLSTLAKDESSTTENRYTLTNINLQVNRGDLTIVMGKIGQGKSSLISALIGDMYK